MPRWQARLQARVVLLTAVALILLAGQAATAALAIRQNGDAVTRQHLLIQLRSDLQQLLIAMDDQETGIRGYSSTGMATFLEPYQRGHALQAGVLGPLAAAARTLRLGTVLTTTIDRAAAWAEWAEGRRLVVAAAGTPLIDVSASEAGKTLFDAFRQAWTVMDARVGGLLAAADRDVQSSGWFLLADLAAGIGLTAGIVLLLAVCITWLAIRPVVRLAHRTERLAAEGPAPLPEATRSDEIGDLARALDQWATSRYQIDQLFSLSRDLLCIGGFDRRLKRVNPAWQRTLGWTGDELLRMPYIDLVHPDDTARALEELARLAASDAETVEFEVRCRHRDGTYRILSWQARSSAADQLVFAAARDVTESRTADLAVREQAALLDLAHDAILVRSMGDGLVTYWNQGAVETYGYGAEEALGRAVVEVLGTRYPEPMERIEERLTADGTWEGELVQTRKDGSHVTVAGRWALRRDPFGRPEGILEVNRDVTVQKRAERRVAEAMAQQRDAMERLRALDEAKSTFVATASHELRTPLTSIMGYTELLATGDGGPLSDDQRQMVGTIDRNARRLLSLVEDLLNLSRIESGRNELRVAPTNLGGLADAVVQGLRTAAEAKGVQLTAEVGSPVPLVLADRMQIDQVLTNLLSNAIKFTPAGGAVRVDLSSRRDTEGAWVVLRVSDTGIGIPAAELDRVFDQFFRSTLALQQAIPGTGLGMSIAKGVVEQHRGRISIESEPGRGTCVSVVLPAGST